MDGLKSINTKQGQLAGDTALRNLADTIRRQRREADSAGRWGGDEFLFVLSETNASGAQHFLQRIQKNLPNPLSITGGWWESTQPVDTPKEAIEIADRMLRTNKHPA